MRIDAIARALAILVAIVGVVDPVWRSTRRAPRSVELHLAPGEDAAAVRTQLERALEGEVTFSNDAPPAARVVVGDALPRTVDERPTSFVSIDAGTASNTRVVSVGEPPPTLPGWRTSVSAVIEGHGVAAGSTTTVVLEHEGVELGRTEHKWAGDGRVSVSIPFVPPSDGAARLSIRALPLHGETRAGDNVADVRAIGRARRLEVLVHEARPSWTAAFVRRVLEGNPAFDVSASAAASRGVTVTAGVSRPRLRELDDFDAVIVGAPEDLSGGDVDALEAFARRRGGTVVFLPDRRPSGDYVRLVRVRGFEEVLIEKPATVEGPDGALRASELSLPRSGIAAADGLASIARNGGRQAVVFGVPLGDGRVVFSGAMDAWRFRAGDEAGFARFWTSTIAGLALDAPPRLEVSVEPGIVQPGETVTVRVRLRGSELSDTNGRVEVPAVQARAIAASGQQEPIRMWPGSKPGAFVGRVTIAHAGRFDVSASSGAMTADTVVIAAPDARRPADTDDRRAVIASATGGVHVSSRDLTPLLAALRDLPAPAITRDVHPARSIWLVIAFAALLCAEWTIRRRAGLR